MKHEELVLANMKSRDSLHTYLLAMTIELAAERHPEEMKKALAKVFDLGAFKDIAERLMLTYTDLLRKIDAASSRLRELEKRLDRWEELEPPAFPQKLNGARK